VTTSTIVMVTGAAGGIGRATAQRFVAAGYGLVGIDIDPAVKDLSRLERNAPVLGVVADHEQLASLEAAVSTAEKLGTIRHVVAFAGVALPEEIVHDDEEGLVHPSLFRASIERNLMGHVNMLWAAQHSLFQASGDRSVILCSSVNALQTWGEPGYSTAKAGLIGLVRSLTGSYGRRGVRINALAPGTIDSAGARAEYHDDPERFERMRWTIPLGRLGEVEDVAAAALAIARDLRHLHGAVLTLDGGQTVDRTWEGGAGR
jgi:meso-butanediol dehydrogenase/(S,S)-butanediol dehydrogenase/diacetyl reductase